MHKLASQQSNLISVFCLRIKSHTLSFQYIKELLDIQSNTWKQHLDNGVYWWLDDHFSYWNSLTQISKTPHVMIYNLTSENVIESTEQTTCIDPSKFLLRGQEICHFFKLFGKLQNKHKTILKICSKYIHFSLSLNVQHGQSVSMSSHCTKMKPKYLSYRHCHSHWWRCLDWRKDLQYQGPTKTAIWFSHGWRLAINHDVVPPFIASNRPNVSKYLLAWREWNLKPALNPGGCFDVHL